MPLLAFVGRLLLLAGKQLLIALISDRLMKDLVLVLLHKLSTKTDNKIDDKVYDLVRRALYPEFEAGQPPTLESLDVAAKEIEGNTK